MTEPPVDQRIDPELVRRRVEKVKTQIASAGGDPDRIGIVAVTKGFGPEAMEAAARSGLTMVGENYAQEMLAKLGQLTDSSPEVAATLAVHFIGRLQTNKVRQLAPAVALWQSVDRVRLADEIARRSPGARVLIQLDASGAGGPAGAQGGCPLSDAPELLAAARGSGLVVEGCMAIGPQAASAEIEAAFGEVSRFADRFGLEHRCMGMSADLREAVRAGSTMVRIGTALFGPRPAR